MRKGVFDEIRLFRRGGYRRHNRTERPNTFERQASAARAASGLFFKLLVASLAGDANFSSSAWRAQTQAAMRTAEVPVIAVAQNLPAKPNPVDNGIPNPQKDSIFFSACIKFSRKHPIEREPVGKIGQKGPRNPAGQRTDQRNDHSKYKQSDAQRIGTVSADHKGLQPVGHSLQKTHRQGHLFDFLSCIIAQKNRGIQSGFLKFIICLQLRKFWYILRRIWHSIVQAEKSRMENNQILRFGILSG